MAPKKTVIKVNVHCQICKTDVLRSVTKLEGIDQVSVDGDKRTLTVVGEVDPVSIVNQLKKVGKFVEIISIGPNKPPEKPKSPQKSLPLPLPLPRSCFDCDYLVPVSYAPYEPSPCSIL